MINTDLVKKFSLLKERRDALQQEYIRRDTQVASSRDRYNAIIAELRKYEIGSLEELRERIKLLTKEVSTSLDSAEAIITDIETKIKAMGVQNASST